MNRLQIAKDVNTLAATQGVVETTENSFGYQTVLLLQVDTGYNKVQLHRKDWNFMRKLVQAPLDLTTDTFIDADIAKIEKVIYDKEELREVPYETWILKDHNTGRPEEYTISDLDGSLIFNPSDQAYVVDVYYWSVPDIMLLDTSIPILPVQYHYVLVYAGLMALGSYLGNFDLINTYQTEYDIIMGQIMRTECPEKRLKAPPFVTGNSYGRRGFV